MQHLRDFLYRGSVVECSAAELGELASLAASLGLPGLASRAAATLQSSRPTALQPQVGSAVVGSVIIIIITLTDFTETGQDIALLPARGWRDGAGRGGGGQEERFRPGQDQAQQGGREEREAGGGGEEGSAPRLAWCLPATAGHAS